MSDSSLSLPSDPGADERIDPFGRLTAFSIDHLARYALASKLAKGKRVLDAATGTGFGAFLLAEAGALKVDAVDLDQAALDMAQRRFGHSAIHYQRVDLDSLEQLPEGRWDVVTCFETLEHLPHPERFLGALKARLAPGAHLLISVPGEADANENNPFHLQHFTRASFETLIGKFFPQCTLLTQRNGVAVEFSATIASPSRVHELPLGEGDPVPVDGYLAIAGDSVPSDLTEGHLWISPAVWHQFMTERKQLHDQCSHFAGEHAKIFKEHSDLQEKFSVCLAWGTYYHHQSTNQHPKEDFLADLQEKTFATSRQLQSELEAARKRIHELENALAEAIDHAPNGRAERRKAATLDFLRRWRRKR